MLLVSIGDTYANTFYYGHCTWYVANKKSIQWRGHAKDWYNNASINNRVWDKPILNSIIVFNWPGYNPEYWHVGIVEWFVWDDIIISDMNYKRLWQITYRRIKTSDSAIVWYIYK